MFELFELGCDFSVILANLLIGLFNFTNCSVHKSMISREICVFLNCLQQIKRSDDCNSSHSCGIMASYWYIQCYYPPELSSENEAFAMECKPALSLSPRFFAGVVSYWWMNSSWERNDEGMDIKHKKYANLYTEATKTLSCKWMKATVVGVTPHPI